MTPADQLPKKTLWSLLHFTGLTSGNERSPDARPPQKHRDCSYAQGRRRLAPPPEEIHREEGSASAYQIRHRRVRRAAWLPDQVHLRLLFGSVKTSLLTQHKLLLVILFVGQH